MDSGSEGPAPSIGWTNSGPWNFRNLMRSQITLLVVGAFSALLSGKSWAEPEPVKATKAVTYSKHIAPIFRHKCESCHRSGEVAPMSLLSYKDVRPWLKSIEKEVKSRAMPPWSADPKHGEFVNDPTLTKDEYDTILNWIAAGAPEGNSEDLPPAKEWVDGWRIGTPDVVFEIPKAYEVPAKGVVPYKYFFVKTNFEEDRWIERAEARPDKRDVVHHILVIIVEGRDLRGLRGNIWERYLTGTAPGEEPMIYAPGQGRRIPKGATLMFQMHYTPNGKKVKDRSKLGLVFSRSPVVEEIKTKAISQHRLRIPPNEANYVTEKSSRTFREDTLVTSLMPHMHLRGKSFEYRLIDPQGQESTILSVPKYDFDWQHSYVFKKPLKVRAGSRIRCIATFDNSKDNPANPDPSKSVKWGDQTWEEMMIGFYDITRKLPEPALDPIAKKKRRL